MWAIKLIEPFKIRINNKKLKKKGNDVDDENKNKCKVLFDYY